MAVTEASSYLDLVSLVRSAPEKYLRSSYDADADIPYVNFTRPSVATDSDLTDDDIIVRYEGDDVIGFTILHAGRREP